MTSFLFIFNCIDGTLYLDGHLDRETMSAIAFEVVARDRAHVRGDLDENINESRYLLFESGFGFRIKRIQNDMTDFRL